MVRPLSVNEVMSVPIVAMASVTRNILAGPRLARSAIADGRGIDMDAVGDQPGPQRAGVDRGADQPGLAVADLAHRVEEMRDHRGAGFGRSRAPRR